jgi:hypothetical protein
MRTGSGTRSSPRCSETGPSGQLRPLLLLGPSRDRVLRRLGRHRQRHRGALIRSRRPPRSGTTPPRSGGAPRRYPRGLSKPPCRLNSAESHTSRPPAHAKPGGASTRTAVAAVPCMTASTNWPRIGPAAYRATTQEKELRRAANPQVGEHLTASPQVVLSVSRTLSRWRHGFKSRWDYEAETARSAVLFTHIDRP